jgi:predicted nucleic acid-binding protein
MAMATPSNPPCLTLDANILIALCAKEVDKFSVADAELNDYASKGYIFYAPGVIIDECLYVLCKKLMDDGSLTPAEHAAAVADLCAYMGMISPPPNGDASLIARAEQIRSGYGCSRSADGIYIALAEELSAIRTTEFLTFDGDTRNQALRNAPTVSVRLLSPVPAGSPPPPGPPLSP